MKHILTFNLFEGKVKKSDKIDIFRNEKYIVVRPLTHQASCKYGAFTQWCISVPNAEYVWESSKDAIVIFILQKNYNISSEKEDVIRRFLELNEKEQEGEIDEEETDEYLRIMGSREAEDLSKIALIFSNDNLNNPEIWDANNIKLNDNYPYGYRDLPIDNSVIEAIENYIETL